VKVKSGKRGARVAVVPVSAICRPFPQQSLRLLHFSAMWLLHVWGFMAANNRNLQEEPVMCS
jgi:type II secretory pathway component PulL